MGHTPRRMGLWGACSGAALLLGLAVVLALGARQAGGDVEAAGRARQALAIWGSVVLAKGLLPGLLLLLGLYRGLAARGRFEASRRRLLLGVAGCALTAGLLSAALLLPLPLPGLPAVVYRGSADFAATALQLAGALGLAALLPRLLLPALRPAGR